MKRLIRNVFVIALPVSLALMSSVSVSGMEKETWEETKQVTAETQEEIAAEEINADELIVSGTCGENANFTLDKNGVLRITGSGEVDDSTGWYDYLDQIQKVEVFGPSELGSWLFPGHSSLKNIILGDSVNVIGYNCFSQTAYNNDSVLESVQFGSGIREIETGAFFGNENQKKIIISDLASWCSADFGHAEDMNKYQTGTSPLEYGAELILDGKRVTELTIPSSVERIGSSVFENYRYLEKVVIPATVKRIGCNAFAYTPKLTSVIFEGHAPDPELFNYSIFTYASGILYSNMGEKLVIQHPIGDATYTNRIRSLYSSGYMVVDPPEDDPNDDWDDIFTCTYEDKETYFCNRVEWPEPNPNLVAHGGCGKDMIWSLDKKGVLTITGSGEMDSYEYVYKWDDYDDDIKKIVIEEGVQNIEYGAFSSFDIAKGVLIPESVVEIEKEAFGNYMERLKYVCYAGSEEQWKKINIGEDNDSLLNAKLFFNGEIPDDIDQWFPVKSVKLNITQAEMPTSRRPELPSMIFLEAIIEPENADVKDVRWYSSDPEIATVNGGMVTAHTYGRTTIFAQSVDGMKTAACEIQTRYYDVAGSPIKGDKNYQYFFTPVYWAADMNITKGYGNVYFGPDANCTREQMITFLYRTAGSPKVSGTVSFSDVQKGSYYYNAVLWAAKNGITNGYTSGPNKGKFGVGMNVTREDTMTFIYRMAGRPKYSTSKSFKDISRGKYYYDAVRWAAQNGITNGYSDGTFGVGKNVLRKDIVTFLYRYAMQ